MATRTLSTRTLSTKDIAATYESPQCEPAVDDVIAAVQSHLSQHKRHALSRHAAKSRMQDLSESLVRLRTADAVGDDFFEEKQDARRGPRVQLAIAGVQDRAGKTVKMIQRLRGSRNHEAVLEPEADIDISEDELDEPATRTTTRESNDVYGAQGISFSESPTGSADSLTSAATSTSAGLRSDLESPGLVSNVSGFDQLARAPTLPTLTEHPSRQNPASSFRAAPRRDPQSRTLTIGDDEDDEGGASSRNRRTRLSKMNPRELNKSIARRRHRQSRRPGQKVDHDGSAALEQALLEAGVVKHEKERYEVDVLYEHQRGLVVFGLPQFSSSALFQLDPAAWTDSRLKNSAVTRHDHPLPTPFWHWVDKEWMVDMSGDTDEQGWSYAVRFRSKFWRGQPDTWRSFVRRRRWIRTRVYIPQLPFGSPPSNLVSDMDWDAVALAVANGTYTGPLGLLSACAALPLMARQRDEIYRWDPYANGSAQTPFVNWAWVKAQGELAQRSKPDAAECDNNGNGADRGRTENNLSLWHRAVLEINYHRVASVLRECRLDREKLALWRWWLGLEPIVDSGPTESSGAQEVRVGDSKARAGRRDRQASVQLPHSKPRENVDARDWDDGDDPRPDLNDVMDLLEGKASPRMDEDRSSVATWDTR